METGNPKTEAAKVVGWPDAPTAGTAVWVFERMKPGWYPHVKRDRERQAVYPATVKWWQRAESVVADHVHRLCPLAVSTDNTDAEGFFRRRLRLVWEFETPHSTVTAYFGEYKVVD